jgi:hypothetical protein
MNLPVATLGKLLQLSVSYISNYFECELVLGERSVKEQSANDRSKPQLQVLSVKR